MTWKFHPDAAEEYLEACKYYTEIEGKLGVAFPRSVEAAIDRIVAQPTAWREIEEDVRRHLLKRFPYGIYYTMEEGFVPIVSVMHMKRKPGHWRNRLT